MMVSLILSEGFAAFVAGVVLDCPVRNPWTLPMGFLP